MDLLDRDVLTKYDIAAWASSFCDVVEQQPKYKQFTLQMMKVYNKQLRSRT